MRTIAGSARSMGLVVEGLTWHKISKRFKADAASKVDPGKPYASTRR